MVLLWWVADFVTHPRISWHHCPRNKNNMNNQEHKALGVNPFPRFLWKCSLPAPVLDVRAADGSTQLVGEFPSENWRWSTMAIKPTASINPLLVLAMTCWKFLNWIQIRKLNASGRHWTSSSHPIKGKHMHIFALFGVQGSHEFVGSCRIPIFRVRSSSLKISKDFKRFQRLSFSFPQLPSRLSRAHFGATAITSPHPIPVLSSALGWAPRWSRWTSWICGTCEQHGMACHGIG